MKASTAGELISYEPTHGRLVSGMKVSFVVWVLVITACTATVETTTTTPSGTSSSPELSSTTSVQVDATTTSVSSTTITTDPDDLTIESFPVPAGTRPHDVAPAIDGGVWYTGQGSGVLGWLDPETGDIVEIPLGEGSRPHGVIVDDEGTPWITDGGLNAIVSVDPETQEVTIYPMPDFNNANLNTAVFDDEGTLWFTGQAGVVGELDVETGETVLYQPPRGSGPYGIAHTSQGNVVFASLAGSYVGLVLEGGEITVLEPPTPGQGARRVWADSTGAVWVSEWNSGNVSRYDFDTDEWDTWPLPGDDPAAYAVYVDEDDTVWLSDFGANAIVRFDPRTEEFTVYELPHPGGDVRQIHGRPGEVWGAESGADTLVLIRTD